MHQADASPHIINKSWSVGRELTTGSQNESVPLQADFDPQDYTIQFNLENPHADNGVPVRAVAFITWSVRGNQVTRRVNISNGVSVTGNAENVRIVMRDTTDVLAIPIGLKYTVTATITKGTRPSVEQPPLLMPFPGANPQAVNLVAPATSVNIPIPRDAGVISVLVAIGSVAGLPIPDQSVRVVHFSGGAPFLWYDPRDFTWVPIAPGATDVLITNVSNVAPGIFVNAFFGIDG